MEIVAQQTFYTFMDFNTSLSPCEVNGTVLYLLDSLPVSPPLHTTAGIFCNEHFAFSV